METFLLTSLSLFFFVCLEKYKAPACVSCLPKGAHLWGAPRLCSGQKRLHWVRQVRAGATDRGRLQGRGQPQGAVQVRAAAGHRASKRLGWGRGGEGREQEVRCGGWHRGLRVGSARGQQRRLGRPIRAQRQQSPSRGAGE